MSYCDTRARFSTKIAGIVKRGWTREAVVVRNLSIGGAMLELPSPPMEGTRLLFECTATGPVDASVVWVIGTRCGVMFHTLVSLQFLDDDSLAA